MQFTRWNYVLLNASLLLEALVYGLIAPIVPYYAQETGASTSQLGSIFSIYSLALLLGSFPAGYATDRIGRRPVLIAGLLLLLASTLSFAWSADLWMLLFSRALQGLAGAAIWTAALAAAAAMFAPQERGSRMGLMMAFTGLGTIAGPLFSGLLLNTWGYRAPFFTTGAIVLLVTLGFVWHSLPEPVQEKEKKTTTPVDIYKSFKGGKLALVMILVACVSFSFGLLELLLPLHLSGELKLNSLYIGIVFGVISLSFSISQPIWGYISDRAGYWPVILAGVAGTALALPMLSLAKQMSYLYAVCGFYGLISAAMLTPCLPLLADYSEMDGNDVHGKNFSMVNAAYAAGLLVGPVAGGVVAQHTSFTVATLLYSGLLLLIGLVIVITRTFPVKAA